MKNELLKKNLDALSEFNKIISDEIEKSKSIEDVTFEKNNFFIKFKSATFPAYKSLENLRNEINEAIKKIPMERGAVTVIVGCGYGHMMHKVLSKKNKNHIVLLVEPNLFFVKEAFSRFNFTKWIKNNSFFIVSKKDDIGLAICTIEANHVVEGWSVLIDPYTVYLPTYSESIQKVNEYINQVRCNTGTVMGAGKTMAHNDIESLPYVIRSRGVNQLKDLYKGKPAVLVSTGPSLEKNIWRLKEYQDNIIIVSVAQALRTLLAYDIRPDFITTVDFGDINFSHFEGLMDCNVPLICLNRTYAKILKQYEGVKFISGSNQINCENSMVGILEKKGFLDSGGSVAHFNLSAAALMGCNPLIFIGQDLSWTTKTHAATLDENGDVSVENGQIFWTVTDPRSKLKKLKKMCVGPAVYLPGYFGESVVTNVGLASFVTSFDAMIASMPSINFINSTEGGVHLKKTERMSLKDSLEKYCSKKIDKLVINKIMSLDDNTDDLISEAIIKIKMDIENCDIIINDGQKAFEAAGQMEGLAKKNKYSETKMTEYMRLNADLSSKSEEAAKKCPLIGVSILTASRRLYSNELYVEKTKVKDMLSDRTGLMTRIKRNKMILSDAIETSKDIKKWCIKSLGILEKYQKTKDEAILTEKSNYAPTVKDSGKFFDVGNWATPLVDARQCVEKNIEKNEARKIIKEAEKMREESIMKWRKEPDLSVKIQYQSLIDAAKEKGFEQNKFAEALELLKKAKKLQPNEFPARWGIANTLLILKKSKEAIKEYVKLMKDFPGNVDIKFEYGCALLDRSPEEGLKQMISVMEITEKYDHMFIHIGALYKKAGETKKALDAFNQYLEKFPNDPIAQIEKKDCERILNGG